MRVFCFRIKYLTKIKILQKHERLIIKWLRQNFLSLSLRNIQKQKYLSNEVITRTVSFSADNIYESEPDLVFYMIVKDQVWIFPLWDIAGKARPHSSVVFYVSLQSNKIYCKFRDEIHYASIYCSLDFLIYCNPTKGDRRIQFTRGKNKSHPRVMWWMKS